MARAYRAEGKNLYQAMQDLYQKYGYHHNRTLAFTFEGASGAARMAEIMDSLRADGLDSVAGKAVLETLDYQPGLGALPPANVIEFDLEDSCKVIVRPSWNRTQDQGLSITTGASMEDARGVGDELAAALNVLFQ